ncbi:MAG: hypothetical protein LBB18_01310 [Puniceicoccales bacterium]|nr:hypothetical protein [Puniceicoccales bacterium]
MARIVGGDGVPTVAACVIAEVGEPKTEIQSCCAFAGYSIGHGDQPLRLRGGASDDVARKALEERKAELPNVDDPSEVVPMVADGSDLWNGVGDDVKKALKEREFVFLSDTSVIADDQKVKFSFYRKKLTVAEAKNMALFAILTMMKKHPELFSENDRPLRLIGAFGEDKIHVEVLLATMQTVTEENTDAMLGMLNCGTLPADGQRKTFEEFQKFIAGEFETYSDKFVNGSINVNIKLFLEVFCSYHVNAVYTEPSSDQSVAKIEADLNSTMSCHANFADSATIAESFHRVFSALLKCRCDSQVQLFPSNVIASEQRFQEVFAIIPGAREPFFPRDVGLRRGYAKHAPVVLNRDAMLGDGREIIYSILHTLGNFYHFQLASDGGMDEVFKGRTANGSPMRSKVCEQVSHRAVAEGSATEFVASVFAGRAMGRTYDGDILNLYTDLNGPLFEFDGLYTALFPPHAE